MTPDILNNALILTGPTGSGKSALAVELAERLGAEIVSMDSMTLYRGLDVGTAKPNAGERRRVPHHLIDVLDPWESASVAWWLEKAADCVRDIESRGRQALIVGGTPLYLKALLYGLFDGPPVDLALRQRLAEEAERLGSTALHARLAAVDPASRRTASSQRCPPHYPGVGSVGTHRTATQRVADAVVRRARADLRSAAKREDCLPRLAA